MNGILIVHKKASMTSRDVVNQVGKILHTKKIGHTGTLDPMATGVLVLCIGSATKLVELLTSTEKEYIAEITFGIETDTLDITGTILKKEKVLIAKEQIEKVLKSMIGTYKQEVPIYSAVHVNGKKLYEYARKNETVKLPFREVTISKLELLNVTDKTATILAKVSKGTYIRSLVRDIARNLGTIGTMSKLTRTKQGNFILDEAYTLEQIEKKEFSLLSIKEVLKEYPTIVVDEILEQKIKHGQLLKQQYQSSPILFLNKKNIPLAIYHTYEKDEEYLKPWKML